MHCVVIFVRSGTCLWLVTATSSDCCGELHCTVITSCMTHTPSHSHPSSQIQ